MSLIITIIYFLLLAGMMQSIVWRACKRSPAMKTWQPFLVLSGILWCFMAIAKPLYLNELVPPVDAIYHEEIARTVADNLTRGSFSDAFFYFGVGNSGYRFLIGLIYAATDASETVVYMINGALGFWGIIAFLELLCHMTKSNKIPFWLIALSCFSFSPMFWSTSNLKEGLLLWGISMTLRYLLFYGRQIHRKELLWPTIGMLIGGWLRPHIILTWIVSVGLGVMISKRRFGIAALAGVAAIGGFSLVKLIIPHTVAAITEDGLMETMQHEYERRSDIGTTAIQYAGGRPTPLVSGFILLTLRPFPHEAGNVGFLIAGAEAWCMTLLILVNWFRNADKMSIVFNPLCMTAIVALFLFSLNFSFVYNMGLMVRQRLQVVPAMLVLAAYPCMFTKKVIVQES